MCGEGDRDVQGEGTDRRGKKERRRKEWGMMSAEKKKRGRVGWREGGKGEQRMGGKKKYASNLKKKKISP